MDKTRKYILLFIILSFLSIFVCSFLFSGEKGKEAGNDGTLIVDKGDKYEHIDSSEKTQNDTEKTPEKSENQGNQKQEQTNQNDISDNSSSHVDSSGSKEEQKEIIISISIKGLDGLLLVSENMTLKEDSSAFDALKMVCSNHKMKIKTSGFGKYVYVQAIDDLKEKAHGANSGWKYNINGNYISSSAGSYILQDQDVMEWYYEHD